MESQIRDNFTHTRQLVKILWTGGFDSTYRMIQLSKLELLIQPYYLIDKRKSTQFELNAISAIIGDIQKHPDTKCIILPLITFKVADIKPDNDISETYNRIHKLTNLGSQYDWLSRFTKTHAGLEICIEKSEFGKLYCCILKNASIIKITEGKIVYCILDIEKSNVDLIKVFGKFHFPLPLFEITKLEIIEEFKKLGFEDTIQKTWFCHTPVNKESCGICNPCKTVVGEGMAFRLSPAALKRYKTEMKYNKRIWFTYYKKIRYRLIGY